MLPEQAKKEEKSDIQINERFWYQIVCTTVKNLKQNLVLHEIESVCDVQYSTVIIVDRRCCR